MLELTTETKKQALKFQQDEIDGSVLYRAIAKHQKVDENRRVLDAISDEEHKHYEIWKSYTGEELQPNWIKVRFFILISYILGDTFTIKYFEQMEDSAVKNYEQVKQEIPELDSIIKDEQEHEDILMDMLDEERLHYVGAMVLGLNDALVELTGTIAGLTFALQNTRLVALSAIITGAAATLSMAASNYLAERANGNSEAIKSSVYTGVAYLVTVVIMVLPYLLLPNELYLVAFIIMIVLDVTIIFLFNYYVSVAQSTPFFKRFAEMALISLGVAAISFVIGVIAKALLGVDI